MNGEGEARAEVFAPRGRSASGVLVQPRPHKNVDYAVYVGGRGTPTVYLHRRVAKHVEESAAEAVPNETIGMLVGRPCRDERGTYAVVEAAVTAAPEEFEGTSGAVRISAGGRSALQRRAAARHPALESIGWWHSHPNGAPRYSSVDLEEQATYPQPYHVGVVVAAQWRTRDWNGGGPDPLGVYVGPRATRLELAFPAGEGEVRRAAPQSVDDPWAADPAAPPPDRSGDRAVAIALSHGRRQAVALTAVVLVAVLAAAVWVHTAIDDLEGTTVERAGTGAGPARVLRAEPAQRQTQELPLEAAPWGSGGE